MTPQCDMLESIFDTLDMQIKLIHVLLRGAIVDRRRSDTSKLHDLLQQSTAMQMQVLQKMRQMTPMRDRHRIEVSTDRYVGMLDAMFAHACRLESFMGVAPSVERRQ
jgi:hypothetical protein